MKTKTKRLKAFKPARAKRKLDRLFSELILLRDGRKCCWCRRTHAADGRPLKFDNSHIIPREFLALRWDPKNSVCLCFGCHKRRGTSWHGSPLQAVHWLRDYLGDVLCDELLRDASGEFLLTRESAARVELLLKSWLDKLYREKAFAKVETDLQSLIAPPTQ